MIKLMLSKLIEQENEVFLREVRNIIQILKDNKYIFRYQKPSSLTHNINLEIPYEDKEIISLANKLKNFDCIYISGPRKIVTNLSFWNISSENNSISENKYIAILKNNYGDIKKLEVDSIEDAVHIYDINRMSSHEYINWLSEGCYRVEKFLYNSVRRELNLK